VLTNEEQLADLAARRPPPAPPADAALRIVQTPLDGQAKELDRERVRAAIGGPEPVAAGGGGGAFAKLMASHRRPAPRPAEPETTGAVEAWAKLGRFKP
jgi:hypothetical protein